MPELPRSLYGNLNRKDAFYKTSLASKRQASYSQSPATFLSSTSTFPSPPYSGTSAQRWNLQLEMSSTAACWSTSCWSTSSSMHKNTPFHVWKVEWMWQKGNTSWGGSSAWAQICKGRFKYVKEIKRLGNYFPCEGSETGCPEGLWILCPYWHWNLSWWGLSNLVWLDQLGAEGWTGWAPAVPSLDHSSGGRRQTLPFTGKVTKELFSWTRLASHSQTGMRAGTCQGLGV